MSLLSRVLSPASTSPAAKDAPPATGEGVVRVSTESLIRFKRQAESLPLDALRIRAQQQGGYLSPFKGRGMEFDESRPYQAGDDIRSLDWRVTARTGHAHTKVFREERERPVLLWVDLRASMFFATRGAFKAVIAAQAAAVLAWSSVRHGDRLGGVVFSSQSHEELRPQRGKPGVLKFLRRLATHPAWKTREDSDPILDQKAAQQSLAGMRRVARPGSLIVLLSDFRHIDAPAESHIALLARHNDLLLVSISDPMERELPPPGSYRVTDRRRELTITTSRSETRGAYEAQFAARQEHLNTLCRRHRMYLISCSTAEDVPAALQQGLGMRATR